MKSRKVWNEKATLEDALGHGLKENEYKHVVQLLGRELSVLEVGIVSALYSEHCSYKSTRVHLKNLPTTGPMVLQGPGENAGVIDIGDGLAVAFKIESHNHPSFIEPFQGAATGVGGILRDVFTMGARPIALMNALRFGALETERTKYLLRRAVAGIGFYGNCMGIPTVAGELFFNAAYDGNCLVNAFALGLVEKEKIFLGHATGIGNGVFYVGSKTGRDGIHGATMSSESFDDDSESKRPTVQVGDPFQEKLLLEACLEIMGTGAVVGIQDMGAAGLTSSSYEMADRAGTGLRVDLDKVPQREANMNPYELMLSESQERMLVVVKKGREKEIFDIFHKWDLDAVQIGEVVEGSTVDLFWHGECVSSLPPAVLTRAAPQYRWPEEPPADFKERAHALPFESNLSDGVENREKLAAELSLRWKELVTSANLCSRAPLYEQYDSTVRSNTVIHPGGDAAVVRIKPFLDTEEPQCGRAVIAPRKYSAAAAQKGIALTVDCNSRFCALDPRQGAALSLAESCRNIAAVGATPIGLSDNLNFGSPEKPESMWQIAEAVRGLSEAARAFEIPIVSGNVSLYNETKGKPILPTPMLAVVGLIDDARLCVGSSFTTEGDVVLLIGATRAAELGGTEYQAQFYGVSRGTLPLLDYDTEIRTAALIRALIAKKLIHSCHDLSQGGLAAALVESCVTTNTAFGVQLTAEGESAEELKANPEGFLFSESGARYLISFPAAQEKSVRKMLKDKKVPVGGVGKVGGDTIQLTGCASVDLKDIVVAWRTGLTPYFEQ